MKQSELIDHMSMELFWCSMQNKKEDSRAMDLIVSVHKMGPRAMPSHVPIIPDQSLEEQRKAREFFSTWDKPFLSVFAGDDPVTNGIEKDVLAMCPNAKSAPQIGGGHFYQWTRPKELSQLLINFIREN